MIIYLESSETFLWHVIDNRIDDEVYRRFKLVTGHRVAKTEMEAWRDSLRHVAGILQHDGIPKSLGVAVEYQIQNTSKRIDLVLSGLDDEGKPTAVIVELKRWSSAEVTDLDGVVRTALGRGIHETAHPSYQAWSYACLLEDFNSAVQDHQIALAPCAYLHNCKDTSTIRDKRYREYLDLAPAFLKYDSAALAAFVREHIEVGDTGDTIRKIRDGKSRPSKQLADSLEKMLAGNDEFILVDQQKVVFERVRSIARTLKRTERTVVIVRGGPGTGKSVVAVNLLSALLSDGRTVTYVSKNAAPRAVYKAKLTGQVKKNRFDNLFRGSGGYVDTRERDADVLIVDEAHRLNEKSGVYSNLGDNQVMEIIRAGRLSVFFLDEDQRVTLKDIGTEAEIRKWSSKLGARVVVDELPSQFRCAGSEGYLTWLDELLGIREATVEAHTLGSMDFRVFDSPTELHNAIRAANGDNKARLVAGYCWNWISKRDPDADDIVMPEYGFSAQWNLASDGSLWIMSPNGVEQVGCIHTCQGLEVDTIGVIIGPDLVYRDGKVRVEPSERARTDKSMHGWRRLTAEDPEAGWALVNAVIRNTYRTLMTRGMRSCWVWAVDEGLQGYLKERERDVQATTSGQRRTRTAVHA